MSKTNLQRAYVLHHRPFSETSEILDCFTEYNGHIGLIAKGVRRRKASLQLFTEYWIDYGGKSDLKQLYQFEHVGNQLPLKAMALSCGFYLNELLLYLVGKDEPMPKLWQHYQTALQKLRENCTNGIVLREFELDMVADLGYGFDLTQTQSGDAVVAGDKYLFEFGHGVEPFSGQVTTTNQLVLSGYQCIAIQQRDWAKEEVVVIAKRLMRLVIDHLLDGKTLKSRDFARVVNIK